MKRFDTSQLVKRVGEFGDAVAALLLYEHSMECRHRRIALLRYLDAKDLAAPLSRAHHEYAERIITTLSDAELRSVSQQASLRSAQRKKSDAPQAASPLL
jgi:hypothetical protein